MLNKLKHEEQLNRILLDIYTDSELAQLLAFKGGTACYFFYGLPRFSTDLDFNLVDPTKTKIVLTKIQTILQTYGNLKDIERKANTLFFLLSYGKADYNIKVEISTRQFAADTYHIYTYYGLPIQILSQDCLAAHKLVAILDRRHLAHRDLFDATYFLKEGWPVNTAVIEERTGLSKTEYYHKLAHFLTSLQKNQPNLLDGLGEVLDKKQKVWVKEKMLTELIFLLLSSA